MCLSFSIFLHRYLPTKGDSASLVGSWDEEKLQGTGNFRPFGNRKRKEVKLLLSLINIVWSMSCTMYFQIVPCMSALCFEKYDDAWSSLVRKAKKGHKS